MFAPKANNCRSSPNRGPGGDHFPRLAQRYQKPSTSSTQQPNNNRGIKTNPLPWHSESKLVTPSKKLDKKSLGTAPAIPKSCPEFDDHLSYTTSSPNASSKGSLPSKPKNPSTFETILCHIRLLTRPASTNRKAEMKSSPYYKMATIRSALALDCITLLDI